MLTSDSGMGDQVEKHKARKRKGASVLGQLQVRSGFDKSILFGRMLHMVVRFVYDIHFN